MVSLDHAEPADILDRLLWRDAQQLCDRHRAPDLDNQCVWCGHEWPCPPRRLAERAARAAQRNWREAWTARHDLNGALDLPGWRAELGNRVAAAHLDTDSAVDVPERGQRSGTNRGPLD